MLAEDTFIDSQVINLVRAQLSLELDPTITNPFSTAPNRETLIKDAINRSLSTATDLSRSHDSNYVDELYGELVGLGPLQPLMADPQITDILVNRFDEIFVEKQGKLQLTTVRFRHQAHLEQVIGKIVALVGREISIDKPLVDARMVDGSRANAVYYPVGGPTLCIRKFNKLRLALLPQLAHQNGQDWVSFGGMSETMANFLQVVALARATTLVVGATGSGKSTLLRSIVDVFPKDERIITIEDTAELELNNPHWVKLECVHQLELAGKDTSSRKLDVADLVQNSLRMRPDRLIIGEIRNNREAYHTLEALNTGHDGSATTIHASSAADALARLELLVGRNFYQLPPREIRGYIARVFDIIVFISRRRNGQRCVMEICELVGVDSTGNYRINPVFQTRIEHKNGKLIPSFEVIENWQPGERLLRKMQFEGLSWTT